MKTLYLDCGMGAAGDMLTAALLSLLPDPDAMVDRLNGLGIPGVEYRKEPAVKCGITGTSVRVLVNGAEEGGDEHHHEGFDHHHHHHEEDDHHHHHDHEDGHHHHHRSLGEIREMVQTLPLDPVIREHILSVYTSIAEAEGHVHGKTVEEIHFHEVGTWDAVADVTAVCLILNELAPDEIIVSPIHVGSGQVRCAHGILPVPAPATAYLLRDIPIYSGEILGELCTPTGAALLRHFATGFGKMPVLRPSAIGYGMGKKDFPAANCVRAILGEPFTEPETASSLTGSPEKLFTEPAASGPAGSPDDSSGTPAEGNPSSVLTLSCNVDDMTAEELGFAMEQLFSGGAREVFTTPVNMKKSRPGTLLTVICNEADRGRILRLLFLHTTTIGVREEVHRRYTLDRRIETVETPYGMIRRKTSTGYGVTRTKWEYDDLSRIAGETGRSLEEIRKELSAIQEKEQQGK